MKLDVKELIAKLTNTPMIVEQGTSGIWTYRKWSNGTAECWATLPSGTFAPSATTSGGISYRTLSTTFPASFFTTAPTAQVNCKWGTGISWASARTLSTTTLEYAVLKLNNSSESADIYFYAIGEWK